MTKSTLFSLCLLLACLHPGALCAQTATAADFDGDGTVEFPDFLLFAGAYGSSRTEYDLNGSGSVDFADFLAFVRVYGQRIGREDEKGSGTITDRTMKTWDMSYARDVLGMNPDLFTAGRGINAIPAIFSPLMLSEGDAGYPAQDATFFVLGASLNGLSRAYSIEALERHEVVNEQFGDSYVTVAY